MNNLPKDRAYRKNITSLGLMFLGGKARDITIKNLSISGMLAEYNNVDIDSDYFLQNITESETESLDFYFPELQLSGIAKLVRVESENEQQILLGMAFEKVAYSADEPIFKRKSQRKEVSLPGCLFINDVRYEFMTINMSHEGLMIHVPQEITIQVDSILPFELADSKLKGFVKVMWTINKDNHETMAGLHFVKPRNS